MELYLYSGSNLLSVPVDFKTFQGKFVCVYVCVCGGGVNICLRLNAPLRGYRNHLDNGYMYFMK